MAKKRPPLMGKKSNKINASSGSKDIRRKLQKIENELSGAMRPIETELQDVLLRIKGRTWTNFDECQKLVKQIAMLLGQLNRRVRCPKENCGEPAHLRCSPTPRTVGTVNFQHRVRGRMTFHGGWTQFPSLEIVLPPRDKRRKT